MNSLLEYVQKDLMSKDHKRIIAANTALLNYDLDRAKNKKEVYNARQEWKRRMWFFECGEGLKDGLRICRKYKRIADRRVI